MDRDVQTLEQLIIVFNYMLEHCQIMFGTCRDCVDSLNALLCPVLRKIV